MKISELIKDLEEMKNEHGDLTVMLEEDGYELLLCDKISVETVGWYHIENVYNIDLIKEVFTEWDGNEDTLEKFETKVISIHNRDLLYEPKKNI
tara:strand:+ start:157589 stop:157870 length:282 start_codon:yes stop_codon:yes gene_type:complete